MASWNLGIGQKPIFKNCSISDRKKSHQVLIYGLENSAVSTCSSLHRWSSVECILLLKLSWHYWECWLRVKEMSKPSSSAKLSAMNAERTGSRGKTYYSPHGHWQIWLSYFIFHDVIFRQRRDVSERVFMSWPGSAQRGAISDRRS